MPVERNNNQLAIIISFICHPPPPPPPPPKLPVISLDPLLVFGNVFGVEQLGRGRVFAELVRRHGARVHEGLGNDGEAGVKDIRLVDVEDEVGIFDEIDPETQRERIGLPRVDHLGFGDPVMHGLVIQEVKHVLDSQRQGGS